VFSGPCERSGEHADVYDENPGLCGFDGSLEVLGQPSASSQPCEWQPWPALEYGFQDGRRAVAVLDVGGVNDADQQAQRVNDDVPLAAPDLLAGVEATNSDAFGGL